MTDSERSDVILKYSYRYNSVNSRLALIVNVMGKGLNYVQSHPVPVQADEDCASRATCRPNWRG